MGEREGDIRDIGDVGDVGDVGDIWDIGDIGGDGHRRNHSTEAKRKQKRLAPKYFGASRSIS